MESDDGLEEYTQILDAFLLRLDIIPFETKSPSFFFCPISNVSKVFEQQVFDQ